MREPGWLYVKGVQYDHAVKLVSVGGRVRATRIIRYAAPDGWFGSLLRWGIGDDAKRRAK